MRKAKTFLWTAAASTLVALNAASALPGIESRPRVIVREFSVVKGEEIYLKDVADIMAEDALFAKAVETLKQIRLSESPPPRTITSFSGTKILSLIQAAGIAPESIGYAIPPTLRVERGGRVLTPSELLQEVRGFLHRDPALDVQVREVSWDTAQIVPLGETIIELERLGAPSGGRIPLRVLIKVDSVPAARFMATAVVDDWREVPVLNKTLERGRLIGQEDVELVRLNMFKQPADIASNLEDVLGRAVKNRVGAGETLRKSLIDIPALIPQGKKVTLLYQVGSLRATASGLALDDGLRGDVIRVRNEASKKIVKAKVISATELEVEIQ